MVVVFLFFSVLLPVFILPFFFFIFLDFFINVNSLMWDSE